MIGPGLGLGKSTGRAALEGRGPLRVGGQQLVLGGRVVARGR